MSLQPSTDRKRIANLYREAARLIEREDGLSCCAVSYLAAPDKVALDCAEARRYAGIFARRMVGPQGYGDIVSDLPEEDRQGFRVLALCFAAAMVEAGDA